MRVGVRTMLVFLAVSDGDIRPVVFWRRSFWRLELGSGVLRAQELTWSAGVLVNGAGAFEWAVPEDADALDAALGFGDVLYVLVNRFHRLFSVEAGGNLEEVARGLEGVFALVDGRPVLDRQWGLYDILTKRDVSGASGYRGTDRDGQAIFRDEGLYEVGGDRVAIIHGAILQCAIHRWGFDAQAVVVTCTDAIYVFAHHARGPYVTRGLEDTIRAMGYLSDPITREQAVRDLIQINRRGEDELEGYRDELARCSDELARHRGPRALSRD